MGGSESGGGCGETEAVGAQGTVTDLPKLCGPKSDANIQGLLYIIISV